MKLDKWKGTIPYARTLAFVHDLVWVPLALLLAYWLRLDFRWPPEPYIGELWVLMALAVPVQAVAFWWFGLYRGVWRFASIPDLMRILYAVWLGAAVIFLGHFLVARLEGVPRSIMVLYPVLLTMGLTGPRLIYRWFKDHRLRLAPKEGQRVLILGAGQAGELLARDLLQDENYQPVAFLDDAPEKHGRELHGIRVRGGIDALGEKLSDLAIDVVLVAMPSAGRDTMRRIVEECNAQGVRCVTLPSIEELPDSQVSMAQLREVRIEDLLGREIIELDDAGLHGLLEGKRVLVTGAGGSIGSELCRQVWDYGPERLIMLDHGEFNLYRIEGEMRVRAQDGRIRAHLGDVRDEVRMRWVFETHRPHIVLHAAAYKHVPLVEENPGEGIRTNVFGTRMVADLAVEYRVEKFLLVSTDKAVNPTNVMGASKRTAEVYCQARNAHGDTAFITTRFGNVLGSAGSVVPLFRRQIEEGGPVTVTHPEITRFFMTIPEAVSLILQAAAMGKGGEVFVLDMGEPVKIVDLAREMIRLSGREPDVDIAIQYIGLRPGEKLHEELFHRDENLLGTAHPKILLARARQVAWRVLQDELAELAGACTARDDDAVRHLLRQVVPEYQESHATEALSPPEAVGVGTVH
ncbi:MAG: nucleoside-diphosphate sugar epimerase/dehydratase [Gammaproteobacteria bacterium]|nr:nucleoside-diphosphate sugar epimerase/dehydratase [Gammaproteobacteria bacterium]